MQIVASTKQVCEGEGHDWTAQSADWIGFIGVPLLKHPSISRDNKRVWHYEDIRTLPVKKKVDNGQVGSSAHCKRRTWETAGVTVQHKVLRTAHSVLQQYRAEIKTYWNNFYTVCYGWDKIS
jgi:hypothetical protein